MAEGMTTTISVAIRFKIWIHDPKNFRGIFGCSLFSGVGQTHGKLLDPLLWPGAAGSAVIGRRFSSSLLVVITVPLVRSRADISATDTVPL